MTTKILFSIILVSFLSVFVQGQSFFANGSWQKVGVKEKGVYQLDKSYLESIGIDVSNPQLITIYGGDGSMLPQLNSETINLEPNQVPTILLDTGAFENEFSILFYNEGANEVTVDGNGALDTKLNIYSDSVYYYIGVAENEPVRVGSQVSSANTVDGDITVYHHREDEDVNLFTSGRIWLSDRMDNKTLVTKIESDLYSPKSDIILKYDLIGASTENSIDYNLFAGDSLLFSNRVSRSNSGYGVKVRSTSGKQVFGHQLFNNDKVDFTIELDNGGDADAYGYINYLSWQYKTDGNALPVGLSFYSLGASKKIQIANDPNDKILWSFNINNREQKIIKGVTIDDSVVYSFASDTVQLMFVDLSSIPKPIYIGQMNNHDLFDFSSGVDLLIVYHKSLESEVLRFQDHKEQLGIQTKIVEVGDVFDQYSNGKKDISAIRNYAKHMYENTTDFKYLLLFGDCSYDYKDHTAGNTNMIPVYESVESYHNVQTYSSDDFYGFLEDGEGQWVESSSGNHTLDIAIGRFPARNLEEATVVVDKIINYESINDKGNWKNNIVFVADDKDDALHVDQANQLVDQVGGLASYMDINKQYLDSYDRSNNSISVAKDQLLRSIEEGALFVNFTGHGSEYIWMAEELLTIPDINSLTNTDRLPIFITATCEFGRIDDPNIFSGAEALFINEAGAIALVTTTRPVYSSSNFTINKAFYEAVFDRNEEGNFKTIGEIFQETKNSSLNSVYNRNFSLLGDPTINIKLPTYSVTLDSIDDEEATTFTDSIIPGQTIELRGRINDQFGVFDSLFNGVLEITVLEASEEKSTLGYGGQTKISYHSDRPLMYSALVQVVNGTYRAEVALPVEISSSFGSSQILFYAYDSTGKEATGVMDDVSIGGEAAVVSNELPSIAVVIVNENTIADDGHLEVEFNLSDDYGILMSDVIIGKETVLTINEDYGNTLVLNSKLELVGGSAKNVKAVIQLEELLVGDNVFTIQTWDIHGESVSKDFNVNLKTSNNIIVYPNPVEDQLNIVTEKVSIGEDYSLEIKIYNNMGSVLLFEGDLGTDKSKFVNEVSVQCKDLGINETGVYYYDINLRYTTSGTVFNKKGKLIKL